MKTSQEQAPTLAAETELEIEPRSSEEGEHGAPDLRVVPEPSAVNELLIGQEARLREVLQAQGLSTETTEIWIMKLQIEQLKEEASVLKKQRDELRKEISIRRAAARQLRERVRERQQQNRWHRGLMAEVAKADF